MDGKAAMTSQLATMSDARPSRPVSKTELEASRYTFAEPSAQDGADIWKLVKSDGTLDLNSPYAYLLTGTHFSDTSVIVRRNSRLAGFAWAYTPKPAPDTVFVWQIGVAKDDRGQGLATAMLNHILTRPACANAKYLEATVTPSNDASRSLFEAFARDHSARCDTSSCFPREMFPVADHEAELLMRIGPLDAPRFYS